MGGSAGSTTDWLRQYRRAPPLCVFYIHVLLHLILIRTMYMKGNIKREGLQTSTPDNIVKWDLVYSTMFVFENVLDVNPDTYIIIFLQLGEGDSKTSPG